MLRVVTFAFLTLTLNLPIASWAIPISSSDLWDISQGATVDNNTGVLNYRSSYRSDIRDMFGGRFGVIEGGNTLFKDYNLPGLQGGPVMPGFVHAVEWRTPSAMTLRSFSLHAFNEGMRRRAFNRFALYARSSMGGPWASIYDTGAGFTYGPGALDLSLNVIPTVAQFFRAEFVQAPYDTSTAAGPRIQELDGYDTFITSLPIPGTAPAPATLALLGLGLAGLYWRRRSA